MPDTSHEQPYKRRCNGTAKKQYKYGFQSQADCHYKPTITADIKKPTL